MGSEAKVNPVLCMSGDAGMATRRSPLRACSAAYSTIPSSVLVPRNRSRNLSELATPRPIVYRTPLGRPVVPPVYDKKTSCSLRLIRGAGSDEAISSS